MAHYAIGDIQGCFGELTLLLAKISFDYSTDTLRPVGDIVNRGPRLLRTLEFAREHDSSAQMVLSDHNLHLLAVGCGEGTLKHSDTIEPILVHPGSQSLLDWPRRQSLLVHGNRHMMVCIGILSQWSVDKTGSLAREAEAELQGKKYRKLFGKIYGSKPTTWTDDLTGYEHLYMIVNIFTYMCALTYKGELDYEYKSALEKISLYLRPWFKAPDRQNLDYVIVFGYWSSLGYISTGQVVALDTDALWGRELVAANSDINEVIQVSSLDGSDWKTALRQFG